MICFGGNSPGAENQKAVQIKQKDMFDCLSRNTQLSFFLITALSVAEFFNVTSVNQYNSRLDVQNSIKLFS